MLQEVAPLICDFFHQGLLGSDFEPILPPLERRLPPLTYERNAQTRIPEFY